MKKTLFYLIPLLAALLSSCANFSPINPQTHIKKPTKVVQKHRPLKKFEKHHMAGQNPKISLDDFTSLSLDNSNPVSSDNDLWTQIGQNLKIPNYENRPEVQEQIRWFEAHPDYLVRTSQRAQPYLYTVFQEVKSRNLPAEFALLPISESAYYPFSYSSTGATGIWQLMPRTATDWGLTHNFWYDGRRDIFDSTNAALDYLTYLAHYFNDDWLLAIAAYDTGEGNVQRAIARNANAGLPTNFWALHLSAETTSYVPRLLALAAIIAHPNRYSVTLPAIDAKAVVAPVHLDHQINLRDAADAAGITVSQIKLLNPGLSKGVTDPSGEGKLFIPVNSIDHFNASLANLPTVNTNSAEINADTNAETFKPKTQIDLSKTHLSLHTNDSDDTTGHHAKSHLNNRKKNTRVSKITPSSKHQQKSAAHKKPANVHKKKTK